MKKSAAGAIIGFIVMLCSGGIHTLHAAELGVAWVGKSGMADNVMKGFEDGIKGTGIRIEYQKDLKTNEDLAKVVARFEKEKTGMLILRSPCAEWLSKNPPKIPTFIGACNNPSQLGVIQKMSAPEGKITGVSYYIPARLNVEVFKAIIPKMTSVFLLMEKGHPSSEIEEAETREACAKLGIAFHGKMCSSVDDVLATVRQNSGKVTCFIIGSQAMIMDNAVKIVSAADRTPVFSYSEKPIRNGALGGYVADDQKLGRMLAAEVIDALIRHKPIRDIPVKFDPSPVFYLNGLTYKKLGLEIPVNILGAAKIIQ